MRTIKSHLKCELRTFVYEDASTILSWCKNKRAFRLWSADRYKDYPGTPDEMIRLYEGKGKFPLTMMEVIEIGSYMIDGEEWQGYEMIL